MTLLRRTPRSPATREGLDMRSMIERLFEEPFASPPWLASEMATSIPLDVYEEAGALKVHASLPGMMPEDVHVEIEGEQLRIRGDFLEETEREDGAYYLRENRSGHVERRLVLPFAVDVEATTAEFRHGVLTLAMPRAEGDGRREIEIRTT